MQETSKVYIFVDEEFNIKAIDGGYTICNIKNIDDWIYIDEGIGDRYNLCQTHYLEKSLFDQDGNYKYKYEDGQIKERG